MLCVADGGSFAESWAEVKTSAEIDDQRRDVDEDGELQPHWHTSCGFPMNTQSPLALPTASLVSNVKEPH